MSLQVFLQAQISGTESFLAAETPESEKSTFDFMGRAAWLGLMGEVLPRALLSELKLSRMLLGSSSAEQFLLVLAEDEIPRANEFLQTAADAIARLTHGTVRLDWVSTENLGTWPVVRKRLDDAMGSRASAPLANAVEATSFFQAFSDGATSASTDDYFSRFGEGLMSAQRVGWSAEDPSRLIWDGGDVSWPLAEQTESLEDDILFPRRLVTDEDATRMSSLAELANRSEGAQRWGVLRADVDQFEIRLRAANSIEEHIHLSALLKRFIAGEMAFLCTLPEFWRRVTLLHRGGDDFAVVGAWDALVAFAREVHRVFETFVEANLKDAAGVEGKTISLAIAIAPECDTPLASVFEEAGFLLRSAKTTDPGTLFVFGRALEWKRLADAEELKIALVRMVREFGFAGNFIHDLASVYRESRASAMTRRGRVVRVEKPWRTYMQVSRVLPTGRSKEFANLRNTVITHLLGRKTTGMKLRPSSRVGLEWARLAAGN
jgi:CRISPR-associated protein Csm1